MKNLSAGKTSVLAMAIVMSGFMLGYGGLSTLAKAADSRPYCHANSGASGYVYLNNPAWDHHFENNGTPKAGHELDFFTVEGDTDCDGAANVTPTNSLTPTLTGSPTTAPANSPTPTPTEVPSNPSATPIPTDVQTNPSITPTPAVTGSVLGDNDVCTNVDGIQADVPEGWFVVSADSTECRQFQYGGSPTGESDNSPQGQVLGTSTVLGASTLADTGSTAEYIIMLGLLLTSVSLYGLFVPSKLQKIQKI